MYELIVGFLISRLEPSLASKTSELCLNNLINIFWINFHSCSVEQVQFVNDGITEIRINKILFLVFLSSTTSVLASENLSGSFDRHQHTRLSIELIYSKHQQQQKTCCLLFFSFKKRQAKNEFLFWSWSWKNKDVNFHISKWSSVAKL